MRIIKHGQNRYHVITSDKREPKGWREDLPDARKYAYAEKAMLLYALCGAPLPPRRDTDSFEYALRYARSQIQ